MRLTVNLDSLWYIWSQDSSYLDEAIDLIICDIRSLESKAVRLFQPVAVQMHVDCW